MFRRTNQMEVGYSLLGVDKVFRNGSQKLPASNDGPALLAVVAREKALLNRSLETRLNSLDLLERKAAEVGISRFQDAETRKLKSNESRAKKRLEWAKKALDELRAGVCPSAIFDPEAGKPLDPEDHAAPVAEPAPADAPPPPPPPDTSPPADSTPAESDPPSPIPGADLISEGCPEEMRQILLLLGDAALRKYGPPTDEPGPPSGLSHRRAESAPDPPSRAAVRARRTVFCRFSGLKAICRVFRMIRADRRLTWRPFSGALGCRRPREDRARNRCDRYDTVYRYHRTSAGA